jgi:biotin carboxyl carrier protein
MKHIITLIILVIIVVSCSESQTTKLSIDGLIAEGNEVTLKKKQIELKNQLQSVNEDLEKIEEVLNSDDNNAKNPLVTTFIAKESNFMHFLELQGNVVTKQNIILYPEFAGTLTNMYVKEGQLVKRGQKLARVDDGGLSQQIAQVEVQIAFSETTYQRQKRLWEQKIGSEIQFLQTEATYKSQQTNQEQICPNNFQQEHFGNRPFLSAME